MAIVRSSVAFRKLPDDKGVAIGYSVTDDTQEFEIGREDFVAIQMMGSHAAMNQIAEMVTNFATEILGAIASLRSSIGAMASQAADEPGPTVREADNAVPTSGLSPEEIAALFEMAAREAATRAAQRQPSTEGEATRERALLGACIEELAGELHKSGIALEPKQTPPPDTRHPGHHLDVTALLDDNRELAETVDSQKAGIELSLTALCDPVTGYCHGCGLEGGTNKACYVCTAISHLALVGDPQ